MMTGSDNAGQEGEKNRGAAVQAVLTRPLDGAASGRHDGLDGRGGAAFQTAVHKQDGPRAGV
jgi:hypothetical protein